MDQLSQALSETHLRGSLIATLELGAPWAIDFQDSVGVPIHYIVEGAVWLSGVGVAPERLTKGDIVMFPRWDRHFMASAMSAQATMTISELVVASGRTLWSQGQWLDEPLPLRLSGAGPVTRILSMVVEPGRGAADLLLLALPRVVRTSSEVAGLAPWIEAMLAFVEREEAGRQAGFAVVQSRLAELVFMQIVRALLIMRPGAETAALKMMLDPALGRVFEGLHRDPGRHWTLAEMARIGGLSRSIFAERFVRTVGMTPFEFLRGLRLDGAAERLKQGTQAKALVGTAGYSTAYGFAKAFKARFAMTPGAYRASFRAS